MEKYEKMGGFGVENEDFSEFLGPKMGNFFKKLMKISKKAQNMPKTVLKTEIFGIFPKNMLKKSQKKAQNMHKKLCKKLKNFGIFSKNSPKNSTKSLQISNPNQFLAISGIKSKNQSKITRKRKRCVKVQ